MTRSTSVPPYANGLGNLGNRLLTSLGKGCGRREFAFRLHAAGNHDQVGPEVLHRVVTQPVNLGTVEPRWQNLEVRGPGEWVVLLRHLCGLRMRGRSPDESGRIRRGKQRKRDAGHRDEQAD